MRGGHGSDAEHQAPTFASGATASKQEDNSKHTKSDDDAVGRRAGWHSVGATSWQPAQEVGLLACTTSTTDQHQTSQFGVSCIRLATTPCAAVACHSSFQQ